MIIVLITVPDYAEGEALAGKIVSAKLAACVQILPPMTSVYVWEGEIQNELENLLLIKTLPDKYAELELFIAENHSYDIPEIIALDAEKVSEKYRSWLTSVVT